MTKCFKDIAFLEPEGGRDRCQNEGVWHDPTLPLPVCNFVWCDEHRFEDDVPVPEGGL
jgi:hypothetical protein